MNNERSLLPNNATPLETALVAAAARACNIPVPIRSLWDVDTCPERLLAYLAWSLAVPTWNADWPVRVKRNRIRTAIYLHKHKGAAGSVRTVIAAFGGSLALREWWQRTPRGVPHTFDITLTLGGDAPQDAGYQKDIIAAVDRVKPARSHYQLVAGLSASGQIGVVGAAKAVVTRRLSLQAPRPPVEVPDNAEQIIAASEQLRQLVQVVLYFNLQVPPIIANNKAAIINTSGELSQLVQYQLYRNIGTA